MTELRQTDAIANAGASSDGPKGWPKQPDGTTDWEAVFEDTSSGLVPLIAQAASPEALHKCTEVVIRQLFTRRNDAAEVKRLLGQLATTIAAAGDGGDIQSTREAVIALLRQIKSQRQHKAREHLRREAKKPAMERRSRTMIHGLLHGRLAAAAAIGVLVVFVAGLAGIAVVYLGSGEPVPTEIADAGTAKTPEATPAPVPPPAPVSQPPKPDFPRTVLFKPLSWASVGKNRRKTVTIYQAMFVVEDREQFMALCGNGPWVMDAVVRALNKAHPRTRSAADKDLARVGRHLSNFVNGHLGPGTVSSAALLSSKDSRFDRLVTRCSSAQ